MAALTVIGISPQRGHTGGYTLVEFQGTGFRVSDEPQVGATGPAPAPPASMRVFFGPSEAVQVEAWSDTLMYCQTPGMDPSRDTQDFTADFGTDTFTAAGHGMLAGELVTVTNSGGALPAGLTAVGSEGKATPYYVVVPTVDTFQLAATRGGSAVPITDAGTGTHSIEADGKVAITLQNVEREHAQLVSTTLEPYALSDGETLTVVIDGLPEQTITFNTGDFAAIGAATAAEVVAALNAGMRYGRAVASAGAVSIVSDTAGPSSTAEVTGGTATAIEFPTDQATGSDDVAVVPGEHLVIPKAFAPVRPNLSEESHLATVVGQLVLGSRRQILENVSYTTSTDWDDETGDMLQLTTLSKLPALLVVGLSLSEDQTHRPEQEETHNLNDADVDGDFIATRPPVLLEIAGTLVGVTDDPAELLNLIQATSVFFKKNQLLSVPRAFGDSTAGTIDYDLQASTTAQISITAAGNNTNLQHFAHDFRIEGIRLEVMPGMASEGPSLMPAGFPAEAIVSQGKTVQTVEVSIHRKPLS